MIRSSICILLKHLHKVFKTSKKKKKQKNKMITFQGVRLYLRSTCPANQRKRSLDETCGARTRYPFE